MHSSFYLSFVVSKQYLNEKTLHNNLYFNNIYILYHEKSTFQNIPKYEQKIQLNKKVKTKTSLWRTNTDNLI